MRAAGQERRFLQQVLGPLPCLGAHPSFHDNTQLAQSASQQGLQKKERGDVHGVPTGGVSEAESLPALQTHRGRMEPCTDSGQSGTEPHSRNQITALKILYGLYELSKHSPFHALICSSKQPGSWVPANEQSTAQRPSPKPYRDERAGIRLNHNPDLKTQDSPCRAQGKADPREGARDSETGGLCSNPEVTNQPCGCLRWGPQDLSELQCPCVWDQSNSTVIINGRRHFKHGQVI